MCICRTWWNFSVNVWHDQVLMQPKAPAALLALLKNPWSMGIRLSKAVTPTGSHTTVASHCQTQPAVSAVVHCQATPEHLCMKWNSGQCMLGKCFTYGNPGNPIAHFYLTSREHFFYKQHCVSSRCNHSTWGCNFWKVGNDRTTAAFTVTYISSTVWLCFQYTVCFKTENVLSTGINLWAITDCWCTPALFVSVHTMATALSCRWPVPHMIDRLLIVDLCTYQHCSNGPASPTGAHPHVGEWTISGVHRWSLEKKRTITQNLKNESKRYLLHLH